jgi:hypothetical protein
MKWFALACLACATGCPIDIDLGNDRQPDAGFSPTPVTPFEVCPPRAELRSYRITLEPTAVSEPSCWNGGGVPVDHTLAEETFEVLLVQRRTLGVLGMAPQKLGDSPAITVGQAIGGNETRYEWISTHVSPSGLRQTSARFDFDRLDTLETAGVLRLESSWVCPRFTTCVTPSDSRSCTVERRLIASVIQPNASWTAVTTPVLSGARPHLVVIDLGVLSRPEGDCVTPEMPATRELTPNARAIEVWQLAWPLVRAPARTYVFRGAPAVETESDFGPIFQQHVTMRDAGVDARETRTTTAVLNLPCGNEGGRGLELASRYECEGTGCAALEPPEDRGLCSVSVPYATFDLGL